MTTTPRLSKSQTQVNAADSGAQTDGQIAATHDGGYVIVWHSINFIIGQRYDSAGNKLNSEVIAGFNFGEQTTPAVTVLANGNIAVAFVDVPAADVYVQIFAPTWGSPLRLDAIGGGTDQSLPSITPFADGSYVVAYTAATSSVETSVLAKVVSAAGAVGSEFALNSETDSQTSPELATLSNGNFVAVYEDEFFGSATDHDIKYGIFTKTGFPLTSGAVPGANSNGLETDPDVAALRDGGFVVVWTDPTSSVHDIRASILSNAGATVAPNILVNTTTTATQDEASVVALADGGFLVTWEDDLTNLVRAQRFDAVGSKIGVEFTVKNGVSDGFFGDSPEAALLSDGRIAFALGNVEVSDHDVVTSIWRVRDVSHDFDGDGKSGVLWRHDSGQVYFWEMDGLGIKAEGGAAHAPVPNDWHIQGAGDFDGDGNNDVLWRHDSGQVYFWEMNGLAIKAEGGVAHAPVPNDWHVQGVGDFDGDGKSDILWRHDSGQVYFWEMNGLTIKAEGSAAHAPVPNDWHIQGVGDFDGDGKSDILWRHDSGQVYFWEMNGLAIKAEGGAAHAPVPNDWHIQGVGDFDGDGNSDILWRHDSGQVYIWEMEGLNVKTEGTIAHAGVPNDWHVQDIGDYNSDGKSDILWRHDSGQVYLWEMNGLQITAEGGAPHAPVPSDWHIFSPYNFV